MADISVEQDSGRKNTWIWAAAAVVAIIALMMWLNSQSQNLARTAIIESEEAAAAAAADRADRTGEITADRVQLEAVSNNPDQYVNETIAIENVPVAAALGPRAFWADIPGQNPFLVVLGANVQQVQMPVAGHRLDLQGTVQPVTDQLLNDWVTAETISAGSRDEAAFATHYLLAGTARTRQ